MIPIGTDRPPKRRPLVNETLIAVNLAVYITGLVGISLGWFDREALLRFVHYDPQHLRVWQLLTYQFAHDQYGLGHIIFNMIFLWVFGNAVEDRLGRLGYLAFYLIGGVIAGLAHGLVSPAPVIGASGAIAGVSGAFLALFPRANVRILILFIVIGIVSIPAMWVIAFYFALDVLNQTMAIFGRGGSNVAYAAHLAGYVYGFAVGFGLLATGLLRREEFDIFFLFKQAKRRREFQGAVQASKGGVWDAPIAVKPGKPSAQPASALSLSTEETVYAEARSEVSRLASENRLPEAAQRYLDLLDDYPTLTMNERLQVEIANYFHANGRIPEAIHACERLLDIYPNASQAAQYRLLMAMMLSRTTGARDRVAELLRAAAPKLHDASERELARALADELGVTLDTPRAASPPAAKPE